MFNAMSSRSEIQALKHHCSGSVRCCKHSSKHSPDQGEHTLLETAWQIQLGIISAPQIPTCVFCRLRLPASSSFFSEPGHLYSTVLCPIQSALHSVAALTVMPSGLLQISLAARDPLQTQTHPLSTDTFQIYHRSVGLGKSHRVSPAFEMPHQPAMCYNNRSGLLPPRIPESQTERCSNTDNADNYVCPSRLKILDSQLAFQFRDILQHLLHTLLYTRVRAVRKGLQSWNYSEQQHASGPAVYELQRMNGTIA